MIQLPLEPDQLLDLGAVSLELLCTSRIAATPLQMRIAHDLVWLLDRKSSFFPGPNILSQALKRLILQRPELKAARSHFRNLLCDKLLEKVSLEELGRLGVGMDRSRILKSLDSLFFTTRPSLFFRFSTCLFAMDFSIQDLFREAERIERPSFPDDVVAAAKAKLLRHIETKSPSGMSQINRALPNECKILRAADSNWLKVVLPTQKKHFWRKAPKPETALILATCAKKARQRLIAKESLDRPKRITLLALSREMKQLGFNNSAHYLSNATVTLLLRSLVESNSEAEALIDTDISFVERRARWAAKTLPHGGSPIGMRTFQVRAGIDGPCARSPAARSAAAKYWHRWNTDGMSDSRPAVA